MLCRVGDPARAVRYFSEPGRESIVQSALPPIVAQQFDVGAQLDPQRLLSLFKVSLAQIYRAFGGSGPDVLRGNGLSVTRDGEFAEIETSRFAFRFRLL